MTSRPASSDVPSTTTESVCVVRWVLRTGRAAIACQVDMTPDRAFELHVVPSWQEPVVERFTTALDALKRHAEVTGSLREVGWDVTDRGASSWPAAA